MTGFGNEFANSAQASPIFPAVDIGVQVMRKLLSEISAERCKSW